jgi:hypothetical protein
MDWNFYISYYKDLKLSGINTKKKAINHYINFGKKENRLINQNQLFISKKTTHDWEKLCQSESHNTKYLVINYL